jgi:hypothetical protein
MTAPNSTYECKYPCQSTGKAIAGGCCDGVWQPYVAFTNIRWLSQVRAEWCAGRFARSSPHPTRPATLPVLHVTARRSLWPSSTS